MKNLEVSLVMQLATECGYNTFVQKENGTFEIFGKCKDPETFPNIDACRVFLFEAKRRHERLVAEMRASYYRLRERKTTRNEV